jgi:glycosyltransferase involved in cell wall biosynthesis
MLNVNTAIVIVNWNGKKYLKDCFDSLLAQTCKNFKIIFVDNGSSDDSADFVREKYRETEIIRLEKNTGFAKGYNIGMEKALEDKNIENIIVLNNDGYGTMRKIRQGCFNVITQWNYGKICELVGGGESATATTKGEFDTALRRAQKSDRAFLIELKIPPNEVSRQLAQIANEVRKMRGSKNT